MKMIPPLFIARSQLSPWPRSSARSTIDVCMCKRGVLGSRVLDPHQRQTLESQYQTPQRLTFPGFPFSKTSISPFSHARTRPYAHTNTRTLRLRDQSSLGHYDSKAQSQSQLHVGGATLTPLTKCHLRSCVRRPWAG